MRRLVAQRFWGLSGIDTRDFKVFETSHRSYTEVFKTEGGRVPIPESAYCAVYTGRKVHQLFIPREKRPELFDAIIHMGTALMTGPRVARFMNVYMAYERLVSPRNQDYSAIRHALSHASGALTHPKTLKTLTRIFGTHRVDLSIYSHQREFYRYFGLLIIDLDEHLYGVLKPKLRTWSVFRKL